MTSFATNDKVSHPVFGDGFVTFGTGSAVFHHRDSVKVKFRDRGVLIVSAHDLTHR